MKYRNASEILPDELLREVQKYTQGELLYVPAAKTKKAWGEKTGARVFYRERNEEIRGKYRRREATIPELCDEYGLSEDTVRSICYRE